MKLNYLVLNYKMGKLWFLCDDCFEKSEKLGRALNDDEMCEECLETEQ